MAILLLLLVGCGDDDEASRSPVAPSSTEAPSAEGPLLRPAQSAGSIFVAGDAGVGAARPAQATRTTPLTLDLTCHGYDEGATRAYNCIPHANQQHHMRTFVPPPGSPCDAGSIDEFPPGRIVFQIRCREGSGARSVASLSRASSIGYGLPNGVAAQATRTTPLTLDLTCHGYDEGATRAYNCIPNPAQQHHMRTFVPPPGSPCDAGRIDEFPPGRIVFQIRCQDRAGVDPDPPTPPGDAVSGEITSCSGTRDASRLVHVSMSGTVRARRSVSRVSVTGLANGEFLGYESVGSMSAGASRRFSFTGVISTEASTLRCTAEVAWTEGGLAASGALTERRGATR